MTGQMQMTLLNRFLGRCEKFPHASAILLPDFRPSMPPVPVLGNSVHGIPQAKSALSVTAKAEHCPADRLPYRLEMVAFGGALDFQPFRELVSLLANLKEHKGNFQNFMSC